MELTHLTQALEGDPADGAVLGDGFCSAIFDAPERTLKPLLNPTGGRSGRCKHVQGQPHLIPSHPVPQQVLHISHDAAATEPASAIVQLHYGSQLQAGY